MEVNKTLEMYTLKVNSNSLFKVTVPKLFPASRSNYYKKRQKRVAWTSTEDLHCPWHFQYVVLHDLCNTILFRIESIFPTVHQLFSYLVSPLSFLEHISCYSDSELTHLTASIQWQPVQSHIVTVKFILQLLQYLTEFFILHLP